MHLYMYISVFHHPRFSVFTSVHLHQCICISVFASVYYISVFTSVYLHQCITSVYLHQRICITSVMHCHYYAVPKDVQFNLNQWREVIKSMRK